MSMVQRWRSKSEKQRQVHEHRLQKREAKAVNELSKGKHNGSIGSVASPEQLAAVKRECELHRQYSSADLAFQIDQQRIEAVEAVLDRFLLGTCRVGRVGSGIIIFYKLNICFTSFVTLF